ncbi:hypothetical protein [Streptomyces paludis]|nr:hypothetical protein [Streptomyces paludis]
MPPTDTAGAAVERTAPVFAPTMATAPVADVTLGARTEGFKDQANFWGD